MSLFGIYEEDLELYRRPKKYASKSDEDIAVKSPERAVELLMESLLTNVVKTHNTVTIKTTPEIINAITGYPNAIKLETDYGTVLFEVTDFEENIA